MKVTFILPELSLNGGIRVVCNYGNELIRLGHDVSFVAREAARPRLRDVLRGREKLSFKAKNADDFFNGIKNKITYVPAHKTLTPRDIPDADFLIATWWETIEWVRRMPAEKGRLVHLMQGYEMFSWLPRDRVSRTYEENSIKIAVSDWVARQVETHHGAKTNAVIHNAVDTNFFTYKNSRKNELMTLGFIYSKVPFKNSNLVFQTHNILNQRGFPIKLLTFHSDALPPHFKTCTAIDSHFRPAQNKIPSLYQSCDLWLFPSLEEGFGLPILESFSCGTPVLATHAGAAPQLIRPNINGYLSSANPEAFADVIMDHAALSDDQQRQMSEAARDSVINWNWTKATQRLIEVLKES